MCDPCGIERAPERGRQIFTCNKLGDGAWGSNQFWTLVIVGWDAVLSEDEGYFLYISEPTGRHWTDLTSQGPYSVSPLSHTQHQCSFSVSPVMSSSPPLSFLIFSSRLYKAGSFFFPLPLDVISKTRSPWQQLVTSSSPTLAFDGCFYFGGFVDAPVPHWQIAK